MLSQGGEFAFVLFTVGYAAGSLTSENTELLTIIVTLSMAATPILLKIESLLSRRKGPAPAYETPPDNDGHVIIAGFGRVGQIVARILTAKRIPFTALDISAEQVEFVRRFGAQAFYGDASRPEILEAADAHQARAFVLAIDDVEASMRTAELVRSKYPDLPIYARARNRNHAHRLLDLGITNIQRETFLSSLDITKQLLKGLGVSDREAGRMLHTFRTHDERRLIEDYKAGQRPRQAARARPQRRKDPGKALRGGCRRGSAPARGRAGRGGFPVKPIICVGHAALDYVYRIEAFPPEPTKVRSLEHIESGGGMAANAAATIARLGGQVELWSRTGADSAGQRIHGFLEGRRRRHAVRAHATRARGRRPRRSSSTTAASG